MTNCDTCDPICTNAKRNHRTRQDQIAWELAHPKDYDNVNRCEICGIMIGPTGKRCDWCENLYDE